MQWVISKRWPDCPEQPATLRVFDTKEEAMKIATLLQVDMPGRIITIRATQKEKYNDATCTT